VVWARTVVAETANVKKSATNAASKEARCEDIVTRLPARTGNVSGGVVGFIPPRGCGDR